MNLQMLYKAGNFLVSKVRVRFSQGFTPCGWLVVSYRADRSCTVRYNEHTLYVIRQDNIILDLCEDTREYPEVSGLSNNNNNTR
jgi:hypothetical protein